MVEIKKNKPPKELIEYKTAGNTSYEDFPNKEALRTSLLTEQYKLCAYCMSKISNSDMKIEHFKNQSKYPEESLNYSNLLACCSGGQGKPRKQQTCDTYKGDLELLFNPSNSNDAKKMQIRYLDDGTIYSLNKEFDAQLNCVLNLNTAMLKNNRKAQIDAVKFVLDKREGTRTKIELQKYINIYKTNHKPYYGAALYYLEKKLKKVS